MPTSSSFDEGVFEPPPSGGPSELTIQSIQEPHRYDIFFFNADAQLTQPQLIGRLGGWLVP